jgi:hypothetical protein
VGVPILALAAVDVALTHWQAHWRWVACEVPPLVLDPYRLEGVLRSTPPGPQNVALIGNSVTEMAFDGAALEARFAERGLRFPKLTLGGSPALTFGMLADDIAALAPRLAVYVVTPPSLRSERYEDHVYTYDAFAVGELYTAREMLANPRFHIEGAAGQLHVLARHRRALQRAALVRLGRLDWDDLAREANRVRGEHIQEGVDQWQSWLVQPQPDVYPNPNTRGLARLARRITEGGGRLLVLEAPTHPIQAMILPRARVAEARAELARLAASAGFTLIRKEQAPALAEEDFGDWVHVNARGREKLTTFLADTIARTL